MNKSLAAFRSFLNGASGPQVLSWRAMGWTLIVNTFATVWSTQGIQDGQLLAWTAVSIAGQGALIAVALIFRASVLPVRPREARLMWALVALSVMGLTRGVVIAALAHVTGLETYQGSLYRPVGSVVLVLLTGSLIAWALDEHGRYRETIGDLRDTARALEESRDSLEMIIRTERQRILDVIATNVLAPVAALRETLVSSKIDRLSISHAVNRINDLIDGSVKPMSRRLHDEVRTWTPPTSMGQRVATRTDLTKLRTAVPLAPLAQGLSLLVVTPSVLSTQFGIRDALMVSGLGALVLTSVMWIFKVVIDRIHREMKFAHLITTLIVAQVLGGAAVWLYGESALDGRMPDVLTVGGAVTTVLSGLVIASAIVARRAAQEREDDLRRLNIELASAVSRISSQIWMQQNRIAQVLHGDVQSSLIVAAARLSNTEMFGPLGSEDITQLLKPIEEAVRSLETSDASEESMDDFLRELQDVWSGVVEIDLDLSAEARDDLTHDLELLTLTAALIREAVGNAYRHGQATKVTVHAGISDAGLVLSVVNAGAQPQGTRIGLGTQLLNAGTISWTRTHEAGVTRLEAVLPRSLKVG